MTTGSLVVFMCLVSFALALNYLTNLWAHESLRRRVKKLEKFVVKVKKLKER